MFSCVTLDMEADDVLFSTSSSPNRNTDSLSLNNRLKYFPPGVLTSNKINLTESSVSDEIHNSLLYQQSLEQSDSNDIAMIKILDECMKLKNKNKSLSQQIHSLENKLEKEHQYRINELKQQYDLKIDTLESNLKNLTLEYHDKISNLKTLNEHDVQEVLTDMNQLKQSYNVIANKNSLLRDEVEKLRTQYTSELNHMRDEYEIERKALTQQISCLQQQQHDQLQEPLHNVNGLNINGSDQQFELTRRENLGQQNAGKHDENLDAMYIQSDPSPSSTHSDAQLNQRLENAERTESALDTAAESSFIEISSQLDARNMEYVDSQSQTDFDYVFHCISQESHNSDSDSDFLLQSLQQERSNRLLLETQVYTLTAELNSLRNAEISISTTDSDKIYVETGAIMEVTPHCSESPPLLSSFAQRLPSVEGGHVSDNSIDTRESSSSSSLLSLFHISSRDPEDDMQTKSEDLLVCANILRSDDTSMSLSLSTSTNPAMELISRFEFYENEIKSLEAANQEKHDVLTRAQQEICDLKQLLELLIRSKDQVLQGVQIVTKLNEELEDKNRLLTLEVNQCFFKSL